MSDPLTVAEWLRAGGIGVGAWTVLAVLVKAGADATGPGRTDRSSAQPEQEAPVLEVPPRPAYPPSTGRHAGPAATDEARLLTTTAPAPTLVSLRKGQPAWI